MNKRQVKNAFDKGFSSLAFSESKRREVLSIIKGEKKMKKKISVALVFAIITLLLAGTALAVVTIREAGRMMAQNEQDQGYFGDWSTDKKIEAVEALAELHYIEKTSEIADLIDRKLSDEEASRVADMAVERMTGVPARDIDFLEIMRVAWGDFATWDYEQKAWYSKLMEDVGVETEGKTYFVEPTGALTEKEAVALARREVAKGYGVEEAELDKYLLHVSFEIPEFIENGKSYWGVIFEAPQDMPREDALFSFFEVYIDPDTGELYQSVEDMLKARADVPSRPTNALYLAIGAFYDEAAASGVYAFREWPHELRARYTSEITPRVRAILDGGDLTDLMNCGAPDATVIACSNYLYGLPSDKEISEERAREIAQKALRQAYDIPENIFSLYREKTVYFDVTNPDKPLWKFFYNPKSLDARSLDGGYDNPLIDLCYKAEIDARTSEIVMTEEFAFETLGSDLEYSLKWY